MAVAQLANSRERCAGVYSERFADAQAGCQFRRHEASADATPPAKALPASKRRLSAEESLSYPSCSFQLDQGMVHHKTPKKGTYLEFRGIGGRLRAVTEQEMLVTRTVEEMEVDLGEKLKRVRLNKNLDQKTLAARSGVSVRALRNLEGGAGTTVKTLLSVVRALGRETWLETVAPVATVNPLTLTARAEQRLRATGRRTTSKKPSSHVSSTQRAMLPASVPNVQSPKESVENPGAS